MADVKITGLPAGTTLTGTEIVPIVQAGNTVKVTAQAIADLGGIGTVTSVGMTVPTGLSVSGSPITNSGTLAITYATGYAIPTTASQTTWDTAYSWGDHSTAGYAKTSDIGVTIQGYNVNTVVDASYVHTDNNYTSAEKTKLAGIAAGAEVNVNADWNAVSGDAQILNKPIIPTKTSDLTNDSSFITASGAPVQSVAGKTGIVTLSSGDIGGLAASATTDTTNAANISSGTLSASRLPAFTGDATSTAGTSALTLANTAVTAGSYTFASITVDSKGRITAASSGSPSTGTVTSVATGTGLTGGPITTTGTIALANTAVTPGSYTNANVTIDAQGRITAASNGSAGGVTSFNTRTGDITLTSSDVTTALGFTPGQGTVTSVSGTAGRITSSGGTTPAIDLATTAVTAGSYTNTNLTVDAYGRITAASNGTGGGGSTTLTISNKTAAYTVVAGDNGSVINCSGTTSFTVTLTAAATLGSGFNCWIWNTSGTAAMAVTIQPNGAETIDGLTSILLRRGEGIQIVCNGTGWNTGAAKEQQLYSENPQSGSARPIASGDLAVAMMYGATASGTNSLAIGYNATASGLASIAIGRATTASSSNSLALGWNSAGTGSQAVTGSGAMALGGSYASGTDSFAAAIASNSSSYGATGANSIAIGYQSKANGSNGIAFGRFALASGTGSVALGYGSSTGTASVAISGNNGSARAIAIASSSVALLNGYVPTVIGKYAFTGNYAGQGAAQTGSLVLYKDTTDAVSSNLASNSLTAGADNQLILDNNSAYAFTGLVIAKQQSSSTNAASWKVEGMIVRGANAASTTLVSSTVTAISNVPGWTLALSADTTNGGLSITATGAAATNIRWVATLQTSEVIY